MEVTLIDMGHNIRNTNEKKMYTYEEALIASTKYFDGDDLAAKVFIDKYALRNNDNEILEKTPEDMHWRMAREFARIEAKKFKKPLTVEEIFSYFKDFKFIVPQGSPMFGIGNNYQVISLSNCYLLEPPLDSYSSILQVDEQLVSISKRRGGVGIDLSNLRPEGSPTKNAARTSTGIVTWMERYSNSIREVCQGGRRGALMESLDVHHPDILTFATIKNDDTKITGANISLRLSDEFMEAVQDDKEYELRFPVDYKNKKESPFISKMISARSVWKTIIHSAWLRAEPGLMMWDTITKNTPADCYEEYKSKGSNPCSEINLSPLDSCRLLVLNLLSFVSYPFTKKAKFDFDLFHKICKIAQRLMDDLVDLESEKIDAILDKIHADPEPDHIKENEIRLWTKIKKFNNEGRRTGTGITALGDALAALDIKYGSKESITAVGDIYRVLKLSVYESSIDMAEELGPFKAWNHETEKNCPFLLRIRDENKDLYERMKNIGRRNIALTTTAPTGTVSILTRTSSGIEPVFQMEYTRRKKINPNDLNAKIDFLDKKGDAWQEFDIYHPTIHKWMQVTGEKNINKSPWSGCCAEDIDWINRVRLQAEAQKHVCHAISSTINVPENVSEEKIAEIYETAWKTGCKGITVYRKNCRSGVLIDKKHDKDDIAKTNAPKRPKSLSCDIHHATSRGDEFFILVGMLNETPYEVFAGKNGCVTKNAKNGNLVKDKRGHYRLEADDGTIIENVCDLLTDEQAVITRMISLSLRHGSDISYVVDQLEKSPGDMTNLGKAMARILKKYVKNGTVVTGQSCVSCGSSNLIRNDGCAVCRDCGWSKCS